MSINEKSIRLNLSTSDIEKTIKRLKLIEGKIEKEIPEKVSMELARAWIDKAKKEYTLRSKFQPQDPITFINQKTAKGRIVGASSPGILYTEFGTGEEGAMRPHRNKPANLDPYNSGSTIRPATEGVEEKTGIKEGTLYWTYLDKNGEVVYTTGVGAGMQIYFTNNYIKRNRAKIIRKAVGDVLSTV